VGDSLAHDIIGAEASGLDSIFVAGGIHGQELGVDATEGATPSRLEGSTLSGLFAREGVVPTWTMARFEW
ncbi:unnamed protein product, partial [Discosporangium mesarthrocarpum]